MPNLTPAQWDDSAATALAATPGPLCGSNACVELTENGERIEFRSTISPARGMVSYDRAEVSVFLADVKAGRYDNLITAVAAGV